MNSPTLDDLARRLRKLEDIEEIRNLRMRYHFFINEKMFDRFDEIYADDAVVDFDYVSRAEGIVQIRELFLKVPRNLEFVKQFIHNHMVEVEGDEASGISYLEARYAKDGESVMVAASMREKYRRTPEGWRIAETVVTLYFSAPLTKGWAGAERNHLKPFT